MNKLYVSINKLPPLFIVLFCVVSLFIFAFLIVCSAEASGADKNVSGLEFMSQSPFCTISRDYSERLISEEKQMACNRYFDEKFFAPWSQDKPVGGVDLLLWGFRAFSRRKVFGENRQPRSKEWFGVQHDNASIESFGTLNRKAISVEETDLRVFPTQDPLFYSFDEPGEGYPFDYLQNSTVQPREPLFVSHISKDGMWAFVNASTASGWMDIRRLAWISEAQIEEWKKHSLCVVVKDNVPLLDSEGVFYALSKVGTILPISRDRTLADCYEVLIAIRGSGGNALFRSVSLDKKAAVAKPFPMTKCNAAFIASQFIGESYGWGGLNLKRDCSATTRDFFTVFGIWLPRNSKAQGQIGQKIDVQNLSVCLKEKRIKEEGIPFRTLATMPGHVMLYIGEYYGMPVFLHNVWRFRFLEEGKEYSHIVGRAVITPLNPRIKSEKGELIETRIGERVSHFVILGDK
ncbi:MULTISPECIES: SH3 domain-containing C40 family peptidase [Aminobacterium]|jgi:cell wall-associated NlpC family hydrolase|uniref:SH3 domain-containing C40 family peptidase n=1 Tax=Aminobacterium TaxID=81466 RepID=UPI00257D9CD4|nr:MULTISPECIES: SH3 domain-containing C40 family peptidase [unclassified Aminobacterium]